MTPTLNTRPNAVERSVRAAIRRVDHRYLVLGRKSAKWTRAVKNAVGTVGEKLGHTVYAAQSKFGRNGQWLFDLTWSSEGDELTYRLPLVMESEWEPKDILWDFSKLVACRADLRVMVFWGSTKDRASRTVQDMLAQIRQFRGTAVGDRYLFGYWTERPGRLFLESYVVRKQPNRASRRPVRVSRALRAQSVRRVARR